MSETREEKIENMNKIYTLFKEVYVKDKRTRKWIDANGGIEWIKP